MRLRLYVILLGVALSLTGCATYHGGTMEIPAPPEVEYSPNH